MARRERWRDHCRIVRATIEIIVPLLTGSCAVTDRVTNIRPHVAMVRRRAAGALVRKLDVGSIDPSMKATGRRRGGGGGFEETARRRTKPKEQEHIVERRSKRTRTDELVERTSVPRVFSRSSSTGRRSKQRHPRVGGDPSFDLGRTRFRWIPAFAGMTEDEIAVRASVIRRMGVPPSA